MTHQKAVTTAVKRTSKKNDFENGERRSNKKEEIKTQNCFGAR